MLKKQFIPTFLITLICISATGCFSKKKSNKIKSVSRSKSSSSEDSIHDRNKWRPMPIRTEWEFNNGLYGGEGEQLFHGIARSRDNPDYVYLNEDVDASWRSTDGGKTWKKSMDRGLKNASAFSIEVDPVNPLLVFSLQDRSNEYYTFEHNNKGLYRSENGGDDWTRVLHVETNISWSFDRGYRHNIAYDPSSVDSQGAKRWYLAIQSGEYIKTKSFIKPHDPFWTYGGIYISEDRGVTWSQQGEMKAITKVNAIYPHPKDGKTLYIASKEGLFVSYDQGKKIQPLGDLPKEYGVRSLAITPVNPDDVIVGLSDTHYYIGDSTASDGKKIYEGPIKPGIWQQAAGMGVYKSVNKGKKFTDLNSPKGQYVFMNSGHPKYMNLITFGDPVGWNSQDGGTSWQRTTLKPDSYVVKSTTTGKDITRSFGNDQSGIAYNTKDPNDVAAFGSGTILHSTDGGKSFASSRTGFTGFASAFYSTSYVYDKFNPTWLGMGLLDTTMVQTDNSGAFFEGVNLKPIHKLYYEDKFKAPLSETDSTVISMRMIPWFGFVSVALQPKEGSDLLVAAVGKYFYNYLIRSEDRGQTWTLYDESKDSKTISEYKKRTRLYNFIGFDNNDPNTVYAGDKVSHDAGVTWTSLPMPKTAKNSINTVGLSYDSEGTWVFAIGNYLSNIYRSRTPVTQWEVVVESAASAWQFHGIDRKPIVVVNPNDPSMLIVPGDNDHDKTGRRDLVIIRDGTPRYTNLIDKVTGSEKGTYLATAVFDPSNKDVFYAAFSSQGVPTIFRTTDGGKTFENVDKNRPWAGECVLSVHPTTGELFAGSTIGTWILPPPYESKTPIYDRQYYPGVKFSDTTAPTIPTDLGGKGLSESSIKITWKAAAHKQGGIMYYKVLRNDKEVGKSYSTEFIDAGEDLENKLDELTAYTYKVIAVSRAGVDAAESNSVSLETTEDSVSPKTEQVFDTSTSTKLTIRFNEPVNKASAETVSNYAVSPGINVTKAVLGSSAKSVVLTTTSMSAEKYKIAIHGVLDASSLHNAIESGEVAFKNWSSYYPQNPMVYWSFDQSVDATSSKKSVWVDGASTATPWKNKVDSTSGASKISWVDGKSSYKTGRMGQGISLDGKEKGAYISVAGDKSHIGMNKLSFSVWAKKEDPSVGGRVFEKHISYKMDVNEDSLSGYFFTQDGSVRIDYSAKVKSIKNTDWHHYALVYNSESSSLDLYVDGDKVGSYKQTGSVSGTPEKTFHIGRDPWGKTFSGMIDEMKIFTTALSPEQIKALSLDGN